jgi:hypothetical protein
MTVLEQIGCDGNRDRKSNQERSSRRARRALDQQAVPGRYIPSFTERYTSPYMIGTSKEEGGCPPHPELPCWP